MKLTVVATLYQSELYITEFHRRITTAAKKCVDDDYEIVLVNDGSTDESLGIAAQLALNDRHVVVVDLSRNFGHHKAIITGLEYALGSCVFLIDVDLEESPELLIKFWEMQSNSKADCVFGIQDYRKGGWFERWSGKLYYKIFNFLSDVTIPENQMIAKLMSRRFVEALIKHRERTIFLGGLVVLTGFSQVPVICSKGSKGTTTYSFPKKIQQLVDSLTAFSVRPLYCVFWIGAAMAVGSTFVIGILFVQRFFSTSIPDGWTSLIVVLTGLSGMLMLSIGVVGIYISKIYEEVKARPYAIVRNILGRIK